MMAARHFELPVQHARTGATTMGCEANNLNASNRKESMDQAQQEEKTETLEIVYK